MHTMHAGGVLYVGVKCRITLHVANANAPMRLLRIVSSFQLNYSEISDYSEIRMLCALMVGLR